MTQHAARRDTASGSATEPPSAPRRGAQRENDTGAMSRRRMLGLGVLGLAAASPLVAACTGDDARPERGAPSDSPSASSSGKGPAGLSGEAPAGVLGANFNEDPTGVTFPLLEGAEATWLRGFVPMSKLGDAQDLSRQPALRTLLRAHDKGYGTVLSLKFQHNDERGLPSPDGEAMKAELARLDRVLDAGMGKANILVIGNEPFLETREDQRDERLQTYYETLARHVLDYRERTFPSGCVTRVHMGALTHLSRPGERNAATDRWLEFVKATPGIEGTDVHMHVGSPDELQTYLDYVLPRLREDQRFLVTEYSLVQLWDKHLRDRVPPAYATEAGLPADRRIWQVLKEAAQNPLPEREWQALLSSAPWYERNKDFLREATERFRRTGRLAVAAYGFLQGPAMVRDIGPDKKPWLLNPVYANRTVRPDADGRPAGNYGVFDAFHDLQREQDTLPVHTGRATS